MRFECIGRGFDHFDEPSLEDKRSRSGVKTIEAAADEGGLTEADRARLLALYTL